MAANNVRSDKDTQMEKDVMEALYKMTVIFGESVVSSLCEKTDNGGNCLAHQAVRKSMVELLAFILPKTEKAHEIFNKDGYNPLHLAVQANNTKVMASILEQKRFDINSTMFNGETALHIAAQLGQSEILGELIEQGGDLSVTDEEGHTPLHDCLQQVYFESDCHEEKYGKFVNIWRKVVEKSVKWWCLKQDQSEPANGSKEYLELQRKAVYYLRSCIKNNNGLSVLQFAADRGLVACVQTMMSTKDVFVMQTETLIQNKRTKRSNKSQMGTMYEIDVTNPSPEYFVQKDILYSMEELERLRVEEVTDRREVSDAQVEYCPETLPPTEPVQEESKDAWNTKLEDEGEEKIATSEPKERLKEDRKTREDQEEEGHEIVSFLDALAAVKPPNKAGEVLESIPMRSLTMLEWRVSQRIHILWMILHFVLMILATTDTTSSDSDWSLASTVLGIVVLIYSTIISVSHFTVRIMRRRPNKDHAKRSVQESIKQYKKHREHEGKFARILSSPLLLINEAVSLLELSFTGFSWAVFIPKMLNLDTNDHIWIKGLFLLFGWLMPLSPLTSFSPIYKLISVLKYIVIKDMFPWIVIYIVISIGFATAVRLQFEQLPPSASCVNDQPELVGFLHDTKHTLFELVIMTSGLDTDLKHIRNLACLFEHNSKRVYMILILITLYAVISAVVLLNMLMAIMSNTVTEAQQDKGWRQYQVSMVIGKK